jgi:RNA polymerase sigma factor (sigma-70 family)
MPTSVIDEQDSDAELLQRWGQGSAGAGNELVERHFSTLLRFFRNKAGRDVEDLVQKTLLACVEARARYRGDASFKTFLLSIARNQLFKHFSQRERRVVDAALSSVRDMRTSPTGALAKREDQRLLLDALQQIPLDFQIILELVFWEGLDIVAIASVLDVPLNTAYSRLRRAKLALREKLAALAPEGHAIDPGQTALATGKLLLG